MKKLSIILLAVLGIFALSSCEDFLDIKPTNSGDGAASVGSLADAQVMLNGIMNRFTSSTYYGRNLFVYGDAKGGDLILYSQGRGLDAMYNFDMEFDGTSYSGFWTHGYDLLLQINSLIGSIEKIEAGDTKGEDFGNVKGQAYTLRALVYFDLVRLYGLPYTNFDPKTSLGVPNITEVLDASAQPLRATVEENYTQILADLAKGAETITKSTGSTAQGYVNYWANKGIEARVYLTMGNYPKAYDAAKEIIEKGGFTLYTNDQWVASWTKQFGSESIFELIMSVEDSDLGASSLGGYYSRQKDFSKSALGWFGASDYFIERLAEDPTDVRHGVMSFDEMSKSFDSAYETDRMGSCYKYLGSVDKVGDAKSSSSAVNVKVIRLSEIYLIAAECALNAGDNKAAAEYLQEIRKRAPGLEPATEANVTLDMILDEKSKELFGEGQRWWDMLRLGREITFNDEHLGFAYQNTQQYRPKTIVTNDVTKFHKIVLPIFKSEMNANPGIAAQQNPGYKTNK